MTLMRSACLAGVAMIAAVAPACDLAPDVGAPTHERCLSSDTNPGKNVSFETEVRPLFTRTVGGCVKCHDPASPNPIGVSLSGLNLSSYDALRLGGARSSGDIVVAGDPCASILYLKLSAGPPFGARMPRDGPPFLLETELDLVHDWIAEGARNN